MSYKQLQNKISKLSAVKRRKAKAASPGMPVTGGFTGKGVPAKKAPGGLTVRQNETALAADRAKNATKQTPANMDMQRDKVSLAEAQKRNANAKASGSTVSSLDAEAAQSAALRRLKAMKAAAK
jgi:hypothetical protein